MNMWNKKAIMFKGASVFGAGPRANLNGPFNHVKTFVLTFFFAMPIIIT